MRGKWFVLVASVVLLALVGAGVTILLRARALKTQAAAPVAQKPPAPVGDINLIGKIRPQQVVGVMAPVEGILGAFFAEVGQEVFEGQLLARVTNGGLETDQQSAQRDLENAQRRVNELESKVIITARLEASRAKADAIRSRGEYDRLDKAYQRQTMLYNEGATPKLVYEKAGRDFETAQAEFRNREQVTEAAEARVTEITRNLDAEKRSLAEKTNELDGAKARTGGTEVVAPAPGLIVERNGEVGQPIGSDKDLFQIATQLSLLEVVLDPDPPTFLRIQAGQPALVVLPDQGGEGITGSVKGIQGNQAVVAFTSPNPAIRPGMMAQVRIKVN